MGCIYLGKAYDKVNREAPQEVLNMHDVGGKLLNGQGCNMSPWLFNIYLDGVMKEVKM